MKRISKNNRIIIRSTLLTLFIILCIFTAFLFMGIAFTEMQATVNGKGYSALYMVDYDVYSVFGKEYNVPVMTLFNKLFDYFRSYSPGIIKLIGMLLNTADELIVNLI